MEECECCGTKEDIDYVIDPYDQDINNVERWTWLCQLCEQIYCDDI